MKQRFPTWWQALLLFVGGIIIFFSSCAGALSGIGGGGGQHLPQNLIAAGLLIGAAMTIVGVVLGIVVLILAIVRGVSSNRVPAVTGELPPNAVLTVPGASAIRKPLDTEQSSLWRLRITIIISMIFSGTGFWSALFMMNRRFNGSGYLEYFLVSYALSQVPYIIALVRTSRRADRVGVSIALAASIFYLGLWGWGVFRYFRSYTVLSMWALTPILDILVLAFAWQASRIHPWNEKEKELVGAVFFAVGVYVIALHFGLVHAQSMFLHYPHR